LPVLTARREPRPARAIVERCRNVLAWAARVQAVAPDAQ
jgi:hypothetical protein